MFTWIAENAATIIISILVLTAFVFAVRYQHKARKSGGCAGCGSSSGCGCCSACRPADTETE